MKYNKGDRVRVKSIDWYNKNKNKHGEICFDNAVFVGGQSLYCGRELTICLVTYDSYYVIENDYYWTDEMIEGLVEEETKFGTASNPLDPKSNANCITQERVDELATKIDKELPSGNQNVWELPDGYQFVDEDGNVINATKIALEKKKTEYPKTYEECCKILGFLNVDLCFNTEYRSFNASKEQWKRLGLMNQFYQLLICRDAYWKIAGDEMGLDKPWEPDWEDDTTKYTLVFINNGIEKDWELHINHILAFPTKEMRDTFCDNFKKDIEICKTLL